MNSRFRAVASFLIVVFLVPALSWAGGTIPVGMHIPVLTDQAVNSKDAKMGQTISGSVAKDVIVGGKVVIPKGSEVKLSVSSVQASGRLSTPAKLYLRLRVVTVKGKTYTVATNSAGRTEKGKGKRDAGFIGGGPPGARRTAHLPGAAREAATERAAAPGPGQPEAR